MADDIGTTTGITLGVDSTPVQRAENDLDRMAAAGQRAEVSVDDLAKSFRSSASAVAEAARAQAQGQSAQQAFIAGLREQVALFGKSTEDVLRYRAAQSGVAQQAAPLILQLQNQRAAQAAAVDAALKEAAAQREAAAAKRSADAAAASFLKALQDQVALQGKSATEALRYRAAQLGVATDAEKYIGAIERANNGTRGLGVSIGQTTAAMRQLPAQFTDIATQLAGGASPLLVLLQQGGQIKDSFGGIGPAIRAVGSAITPTTVAVGALAVVVGAGAAGFLRGRAEAHEYAKAIILSGNAAGTSAGQLQGYAKAIGDVVGTQGKAAEVVAQVAATGDVAGAVIGKAAEAAIRLEREGGPAIEKTIAAFSELGRAPLQGSLKLNEQTRFLTVALYEQIRALEQQGRTSEAAAVAQTAFADEGIRRSKQLESQLGTLPKLWRDITDSIKGAADALLNLGRVDTAEGRLAAIRGEIDAAADRARQGQPRRGALPRTGLANVYGGGQSTPDTTAAPLVADLRAAESAAGIVALSGAYEKIQQAGTKARVELDKLADSALAPGEALKRQIAPIDEWASALKAAGVDSVKVDAEVRSLTASLTARSQVNAIAVATERARIDAEAKVAAVELETINARIRAKAQLQALATSNPPANTRNEIEQVEALAQAQRAALQAEIDRIEKRRTLAARPPDSGPALDGDLREAQARIGALDEQLLRDVAQIRARHAASIRDAMQALSAEGDSAFAAIAQRASDATAATQRATEAYRQSIQEQANGTALEVALIGQSASARSATLAQLQIEIQRRREITRIMATEFAGTPEQARNTRDAEITKANDAAAKATANVASQANIKALSDLMDPERPRHFGDALTRAFEGAGNAVAKLINSLEDYGAASVKIDGEIERTRKNKDLSPEKREEGLNKLIEERGRLQVASYATMAGAAKGFFKENTKGYKALEAAETSFRAFQLAEALFTTTRKLFFTKAEVSAVIAGEAAKTGAIQTSIATQLAADQIKGTSAAAVGIATQAEGEPYSAFARMAIMAAAMASLGFVTGFFGSKGGGSQATAAQRQGGAATGRVVTPDQLDSSKTTFVIGTVLGAPDKKSESIARALEAIKDSSDLALDYQSGMLTSLRNIENSLGGLGNLVVRSVGGGITTGRNLGIATGTLAVNRGDPILGALGLDDLARKLPVIGGVIGDLQALWGKTKQDIIDAGLSVSGDIATLTRGQGVQQFADVQTTTSSFFGLRKKTNESTVFAPVEDQIAQQFGLVFRNIGDTLTQSATVFGRDAQEFTAAINGFVVDIPRLSLKDLKGTELQDALGAALGAAADGLAQTVLPGLVEFQKIGEGYYETLVRVASGIETADYQLGLLGVTAVDYTDVLRKQADVGAEIVRQSLQAVETAGGALSSVGALLAGIDGSAGDIAEVYGSLVDVRDVLVAVGVSGEALTSSLLRGTGGLDALADASRGYFDEFFSETERNAAATARLAREFGALGFELPTTHAGFRALVDSIDDTTAAGQTLIGRVLLLADAFDVVADHADDLQKTLDEAIAGALPKFQTPAQREQTAYQNIATGLQKAGVFADTPDLGDILKDATKQQIYDFAKAFVAVADKSVEAKIAVVQAADALADLKDSTTSLSQAVDNIYTANQNSKPRNASQAVQQANTVRDFYDLQRALNSPIVEGQIARWRQGRNDYFTGLNRQFYDLGLPTGVDPAAYQPPPLVGQDTVRAYLAGELLRMEADAGPGRSIEEAIRESVAATNEGARASQDLADRMRQLATSLEEYQSTLTGRFLDTLSPEAAYETARSQFRALAASGVNNEAEARRLQQAADAFLNASGTSRSSIYVQQDLAEVSAAIGQAVALLNRLNGTAESQSRIQSSGFADSTAAQRDATAAAREAAARTSLLKQQLVE